MRTRLLRLALLLLLCATATPAAAQAKKNTTQPAPPDLVTRLPGNLRVKEFTVRNSTAGTVYAVTICHDPVMEKTKTWTVHPYGGPPVPGLDTLPVPIPYRLQFTTGVYHHVTGAGPACGSKPDFAEVRDWTPGEQDRCTSFGMSPMPRPKGFGPAWVMVDTACRLDALADGNKDDNKAFEKPELTIEVRRPKLPATATAFSKSAIAGTRLDYRVCNLGYQSGGPVELGLLLGQPFDGQVVPAKPPIPRRVAAARTLRPMRIGECREGSWELPVKTTGQQSGWIYVDPLGKISEQDETNNSAGFAYQLRRRGPFPGRPAITPPQPPPSGRGRSTPTPPQPPPSGRGRSTPAPPQPPPSGQGS